MNAVFREQPIDPPEDEAGVYAKWLSPEAVEHFKRKYPAEEYDDGR